MPIKITLCIQFYTQTLNGTERIQRTAAGYKNKRRTEPCLWALSLSLRAYRRIWIEIFSTPDFDLVFQYLIALFLSAFHVSLCAAFGVPSLTVDDEKSGAALPACRENDPPSRQTEARAKRTLDPVPIKTTLSIPRVAQRPGDAARRGSFFEVL